MRESFGSGWATQYGSVPNETWMAALSNLTDQQLTGGLNRMLKAGSSFPPNLTEFMALCTKEEPKPEYAPYHALLPLDPPESDEHRAARKARGAERMAEVKAALRGRA